MDFAVPTELRDLQLRLRRFMEENVLPLETDYYDDAIPLPIVREVDTGPGGMLSRMEEIGYRLRFEDTVTCRLPLDGENPKPFADSAQERSDGGQVMIPAKQLLDRAQLPGRNLSTRSGAVIASWRR